MLFAHNLLFVPPLCSNCCFLGAGDFAQHLGDALVAGEGAGGGAGLPVSPGPPSTQGSLAQACHIQVCFYFLLCSWEHTNALIRLLCHWVQAPALVEARTQ